MMSHEQKFRSRGDVITDVWKRRKRLVRKIGDIKGRYVFGAVDRGYLAETVKTLVNQIGNVQNELTMPELVGLLLSYEALFPAPEDCAKVTFKLGSVTPNVIHL